MTEKKEFIKCWIKRIQFKHRLRRMDRRWRMQGGASYELFPPSFYYTHSAQEIKKPAASYGIFDPRGIRQIDMQECHLGSLLAGIKEITDREISCLRELIRKYEDENVHK